MLQDLRFALRMIASHPWFAAAVVVTLALGIGVNTTVFTLVNAVLFKPVPVPGGDRLVAITGQDLKKPDQFYGVSPAEYFEYKAHGQAFEGLEATTGGDAVISENGNPPERYAMARTTTGLFGMLRTPPILGRGFSPDDGKLGAEPVVLIGHSVWLNRYAGRPDVIGRAVRVNGAPATIIGVMPEGFRYPQRQDVWMPYIAKPEDLENRGSRPLRLHGLLKPGLTPEKAGADLAAVAHRLAKEFPKTNENTGVSVRTFHDTFNGGTIRTLFLTMMGAVGFVLLIACANVANLMLSRALARQREISVRAALGASRWQLIRQLLVESVLLSSLGGLLGLALAMGGVHLFDLATRDVGKPYWILFEMDFVVFGYFAVISVLSGLLFGLAPALRASRVDLNAALKDGAPSGGGSAGRLTGVLVVLQFGLTVVLLAGAGLMVRSFFAAQAMNEFVPVKQILTARVSLPNGKDERYAQPTERKRFYDDLLARLAALPGVAQAAIASDLPGQDSPTRSLELEGRTLAKPEDAPRIAISVISPAYLDAIDLPLLLGRGFNATDGETGQEAAIVTKDFAARHWPGESAIGRRFRFLEGRDFKPGPWLTVVGMCGNITQRPQDPENPPLAYIPYRQMGWNAMSLVLRMAGDPIAQAQTVRATVQNLDPDIPLFDVRTLRQSLDRQSWFLVVFGSLFFSFALIALLMASVGLYAVVAQATVRRTREIGIRMALGSTAGGIMRLVLARGLLQLGIGLVLGLGGAFAATKLMREVLFLTSPNDPGVFAAVTIMLLAIGVIACLVPARRAAALHPVKALRQE
jgi:putative ABC transport system permease protein